MATRSVITPNDQFLRDVFGVSKAYYVDIYQREYKWTKDNVEETLLKDIEGYFEEKPRNKTDPRDIQAEVKEDFEPKIDYTYLTHSTAKNVSIVDGQQRLTTFLLILIKLYHVLKTVEKDSAHSGRTFSSQAIEKLIFES